MSLRATGALDDAASGVQPILVSTSGFVSILGAALGYLDGFDSVL